MTTTYTLTTDTLADACDAMNIAGKYNLRTSTLMLDPNTNTLTLTPNSYADVPVVCFVLGALSMKYPTAVCSVHPHFRDVGPQHTPELNALL